MGRAWGTTYDWEIQNNQTEVNNRATSDPEEEITELGFFRIWARLRGLGSDWLWGSAGEVSPSWTMSEHWGRSSKYISARVSAQRQGHTLLVYCPYGRKLASTRHSGLHIPLLCSRCIHWIESIWSVFHSNKVLSQEAPYCLITRWQLLNMTIINCSKLTCFTSVANFMLLQGNYFPWPGMSNTHPCRGCSSFTRP